MSDFLSSLSLAANSLDAQQYGLDVTGQNIANVNTPGYTDRSVDFAEVPPLPDGTGGGVNVEAVEAARAPFIQARLQLAQPALSSDTAVVNQLATVQTALGTPGSSIDADLAAFYNAFGTLAQDPTSGAQQQQVVAQGQSLAQSFNTLSASLGATGSTADTQIRADVGQVNSLITQIASLNSTIASAGPGDSADSETAQDQQTVALNSLSQLIDVSVTPSSGGGVDVSAGNGQALVTGQNAYSLSVSSTSPLGYAHIISSQGSDITSEITGGDIGGLLKVRDVLVPGYTNQLDQLAYGVATDVNTAASTGYDSNGNPATHFFTPLASASGAAAAISVNAAVVANPSLVPTGATATVGDNQVAQQIANLQDASVTGSTQTPVGLWSSLVEHVGTDAQTATQDQTSQQAVVTQLQNLNDQVSGVSLDEEASNMLKFQQAYEANARFFSAVDTTLDTLMTMVATTITSG